MNDSLHFIYKLSKEFDDATLKPQDVLLDEVKNQVADMYFYTFGIENPALKKTAAALFVAALDGMSIQYSLGVFQENPTEFIELFNTFFAESIPAFLKRYMNQ